MRRKRLLAVLGLSMGTVFTGFGAAKAQCPALPYNLTNGQVADATQVMADLNQLTNCVISGHVQITSPAGGTATIQNLTASSPYNFNLPTSSGTTGQILTSGGGANPMYWSNIPSLNPPPIVDGIPVGRPAAATFSWTNQGTASYLEHTNGPITLSIPSQNGDQIRGLSQAPPSSPPYTLTVKLDALLWGSNYFVLGAYILDTSGKIITFNLAQTGNIIQVVHWNSATTFNSAVKSEAVNLSKTTWLRINNDGSNWNYSVSTNGADWVPFYSESLSSFLGTGVAGLGAYGDNNDTTGVGINSAISIWSFELASGAGTNSTWQTP